MSIHEWTKMYDTVSAYMFTKMCAFLRWINLPDQYWVWLDQNIFNGAL